MLLDDNGPGGADWYEFTLGWSPNPPAPLYEVPDQPYIAIEAVLSGVFPEASLKIKGDDVTALYDQWRYAWVRKVVSNGQLPDSPVDLSLTVVKGEGDVEITEQPRESNGYTAQIGIDPLYNGDDNFEFILLITWDAVPPEPTPTPWPTMDPLQPTPTPLGPDDSPKVLWIIRSVVLEQANSHSGYDEFMNIFADIGAENDAVVEGSQPITDALLGQYQAVVFCNTSKQPEVTNAESAAIVRYVRNGGSIFVIGQQD
ncbi:ThuA domain-containing protein, partial [bacterium]|nr:ThuA domain-containing protein [bacterium]